MSEYLDIAVIGGGASGLCAAVLAARSAKNLRIAVFEKAARTGRKLLVTGSGTCNISNAHACPQNYHAGAGDAAAFVAPALQAFSPQQAVAFFQSVGVVCSEREDGKIYPLCQSAGSVVDCLRSELLGLGVAEYVSTPVTAIVPQGEGFALQTEHGSVFARRVLVCCGGAASPAQGGCTDGYALLTALGHTRTPLFPSIVQLKTDTTFVRAVKGMRADACVTLLHNNKPIASQRQELLFTEYGLSGPAVMYISRAVGDWERSKRGTLFAEIDLLPDMDRAALARLLRARRALHRTTDTFLTGLCHKRIGETVMRVCGLFSTERAASNLSDAELERLCDTLKGWRIEVTASGGMGGAQVTAGGISIREFDAATLQSKLHRHLYAAGEVLDIDGDCGGFNLQWAWASAHAAVAAMEASL